MLKNNLRGRIMTGFALFSAIQFLLMTAIAIYSYHRGEDSSLTQLIQSDSNLLQFTSQDTFPSFLPPGIKDLPEGVHELSGNDVVELGRMELHAYIFRDRDITNYRILQFTEQTDWRVLLENYALFASMAFLLLLGFGSWAGSTIAQRVSKPMEILANKLSKHNSTENKVRFSDEHVAGETALVAQALDLAFDRIRATRQREQTLSRNISHELRTPLTVIRTALDAGAGQHHTSTVNTLASARRACDEMELLTAACLELAREVRPESAHCLTNIVDTIKQIVRESLHLLDGKQVELDLALGLQKIELPASEPLIRLVAGNVIRNAFIHCSAGEIGINLTPNRLLVTNRVEYTDSLPQQRSSGFGVGLSILGQTCTRLGWDFEMQQTAAKHETTTTVRSIVNFTNF